MLSKDSQESSPAPKCEGINSSVLSPFYCPTLTSHMTTGKTIAHNTLFRFVVAFLLKNKCLLISWLQSLSTVVLEPKKIKSVTDSTFPPSICHEVMELAAMILVFFNVEFQVSSFTFIKRFFSSSSFSAICVVSSAYLRLLLFSL